MSKSSKVSSAYKPLKHDKLLGQLNAAENMRRNLYIFNDQGHSAVATKHVIDFLIDKCSGILYNRYLIFKKMSGHLSNVYTDCMQELINQDALAYDQNEPVQPKRRYDEDEEPPSTSLDNFMKDKIKTGNIRAQQNLVNENDGIKSKLSSNSPSIRKQRVFNYDKSVNSYSKSPKSDSSPQTSFLLPNSHTNTSINTTKQKGNNLNNSDILNSRSSNIQNKSPGLNAQTQSSLKKRKKKPDHDYIAIEVQKSPRDPIIEKLRNDLQMKKEEDKRKKEENAEIEKAKDKLKKKINLLENSVFPKKYTYDTNGQILEVKNKIKPKRQLNVNMHYRLDYDHYYVERKNDEQPILELTEVKESEETLKSGKGGAAAYKSSSKYMKQLNNKEQQIPQPPINDDHMKRYEDNLRAHGIIGENEKFDPSKISEEMILELEKKINFDVISRIRPSPGVKVVQKDKVKENVGMATKYAENGFPLLTKAVYNRIQQKAVGFQKEVDIETAEGKQLEKLLVEKEKNFRNLLSNIFPGPKSKSKNENTSTFNELNPLDIDEKIKPTTLPILEEKVPILSQNQNNINTGQTNYSQLDRTENNLTRSRRPSQNNNTTLEQINQSKLAVAKKSGLNNTNGSSIGNKSKKATPPTSTAWRHSAADTRATLFDKYYGREEVWSKRKNRRLASASKIQRVVKKNPETFEHRSFILGTGQYPETVRFV